MRYSQSNNCFDTCVVWILLDTRSNVIHCLFDRWKSSTGRRITILTASSCMTTALSVIFSDAVFTAYSSYRKTVCFWPNTRNKSWNASSFLFLVMDENVSRRRRIDISVISHRPLLVLYRLIEFKKCYLFLLCVSLSRWHWDLPALYIFFNCIK